MSDGADPFLDKAQLLLDLSREISGTLDLQEVLDRTFAVLRRLVQFSGGAIQLIEDGVLVAAATDPPATDEARLVRIPVGEGVSGRIAATGEPIFIPDIAVDIRVHPVGREKGLSGEVRCYFGVPLIMGGRPIGVLQIDSSEVAAFSTHDRTLVLAFAPTIAAAVQNARLLQREQDAMRELQEAEELKRNFLAVVSHELRTPLTSVLGFADTLTRLGPEMDTSLVVHFGTRIANAGRRLARLVDDLLDVAGIERGELATAPALTSVASVVVESVELVETRGRTLDVDVAPGLPPVFVDPERLSQVLVNLIENACKFSPPSGVVRLWARHERGGVSIAVEDSGPGIPPELRERIFERFFQADQQSTRTTGGLGIGLFLVRHLCERMGADVRVDSEPGRGSRFTVWLPCAEEAGDRLAGVADG